MAIPACIPSSPTNVTDLGGYTTALAPSTRLRATPGAIRARKPDSMSACTDKLVARVGAVDWSAYPGRNADRGETSSLARCWMADRYPLTRLRRKRRSFAGRSASLLMRYGYH